MKTNNKMNSLVVLALLLMVFSTAAHAGITRQFPGMMAGNKKDSARPYEQVVPVNAESSCGFVNVHKVNDRYLIEIPDSVIGRDLYTVNRIAKSSQDWRNPITPLLCSYGGDWIGQSMFRFTRVAGDKIQLEVISTSERTIDGENGIQDAVMKNTLLPVYAVFPVKAYGKEKQSSVIDMTDFLNSDNPVFGFMNELKMLAMPGTVVPDRSFLTSVKAYSKNLEVRGVKTYQYMGVPFTAEYSSSILLLSKEPMQGRNADERVGYLAVVFTEYKELDARRITPKVNIWRWRLEPKPEDQDKYFRGELVEPAKPIVFYIDPLTPKKWVPYLIAGVNDWQKAFEKAGFKNAVMAREVDPKDSGFDMNDAAHNVIVYKASHIGNAMGHTLQDPRSGEIIESHIQWYHAVMDILYNWYFTQAGAIDTAAQKPQFSDELMGDLIRFVSSHEIGHALGLRHNWGASSTTKVEQLRNKKWVEENGHTPSIMDYARFNYVAQPEDSIGKAGIYPRIGVYDEWAIEWGYRLLPPGTDAAGEKKILNQWIIDKLAVSDRYRFGIGDDQTFPYPENLREDLGDDATLAGKYGIKNLKRIKNNLVKWVQVPGEDYERVENAYKAVVGQYEWYIKHALTNIGGEKFTPKTAEQPGAVYGYFPKDRAKNALAFLNAELFTTPEWLKDEFVYNHTKTDFRIVEDIQKFTIKNLLHPSLFAKLRSEELADLSGGYAVAELLSDVSAALFSELKTAKSITANRRYQQNVFVDELITLLGAQTNLYLDANTAIRKQAMELAALSKKAAAQTSNELNKAHLENIYDRLYKAMNKDK